MKRLVFLAMFMLFFLVVCKKEEKQFSTVIEGRVLDVVTRKGVPAVEVMVMDFWTDGWNYSVPITGRDTTDQEGNFNVRYTLKENSDSRILKLEHIPAIYQLGARVNGVEEQCVQYDYSGGDPAAIFGGYELEDEGIYTIELVPHTFVYFATPNIPGAWENDSIKITSWDFCMPFSQNITCQWCSFGYDYIGFPMKNHDYWEALAQPIPLRFGNEIRVRYDIYRNGVFTQSGEVNTVGIYADTTAIILPL